jgi:hypothetical protein
MAILKAQDHPGIFTSHSYPQQGPRPFTKLLTDWAQTLGTP